MQNNICVYIIFLCTRYYILIKKREVHFCIRIINFYEICIIYYTIIYTSYFTLKCSKVFSHNTSLPIPLLLQFLKCFVIVSLVAYEIFFKVSWSPPDHFDNLAFVPTKLLGILDEFHIFYSCTLHDHCNNHQHTTKSNYH